MAAPQQDTLSSVSPSSLAAYKASEALVHTACRVGTAQYPSPRRVHPCTLCGPSVHPHQPIVLLQRLEDGLAKGDVNSLRAYGTIRLLPFHGPLGGHGDLGEVGRAMAQSAEEEDEDKRIGREEYTTWCYSEDSRLVSERDGVRSSVRIDSKSEVISGVNVVEKGDGHFLGVRINSVVLRRDLSEEPQGGNVNVVSGHSLVSRTIPATSTQPGAISSVICSPCEPPRSASRPVPPLQLPQHFPPADAAPSDAHFPSHCSPSAIHPSKNEHSPLAAACPQLCPCTVSSLTTSSIAGLVASHPTLSPVLQSCPGHELSYLSTPSSPYSPRTLPCSPASLPSRGGSPPSPSCESPPSTPCESPDLIFGLAERRAKPGFEAPMDAQVDVSMPSGVDPSGGARVESTEGAQSEALLREVETHAQLFLDSKESEGGPREGSANYCEDRDLKGDANGETKLRLRHKLDMSPLLENKDVGIPKIILTLKGNGPNKEYSCSNRLRGDSHSRVNVMNRKHKPKKYKRLRYKEKIKKALKGNKRHLELFGENSNDSCDVSGKCSNNIQNGKLNEAIVEGKKGANLPVAFPTLGESPEHSEDSPQRESCVKVEKTREKVDSSSSDSVEDSSDSLPDLEEEDQEEEVTVRSRLEDEGSHISSREVTSETRATAPAIDSRSSQITSEPDHETNTQGCASRRRRNGNKSGQDSDVSLALDGPVPLPASDVPTLKPISCSEHDGCPSDEPNQAAREQGEKSNEVQSEMMAEETSRFLVKEYDEKQEILSSASSKSQPFDKDWTTKKNDKVKEFGNEETCPGEPSLSVDLEMGQPGNEAILNEDISPENVIRGNDQKRESSAQETLEDDRREIQTSFKVSHVSANATSVIVSSENNHSLDVTEASSSAGPAETASGNLEVGDQYYRPKKIRKMSDLKLSMDQVDETDPLADPQDSKRSWSAIPEKNQLYEKKFSSGEGHSCTKTVLSPAKESFHASSQSEMSEESRRQPETPPQENGKEERRRKPRVRESCRKDSKVGSEEGCSAHDGRKAESSDQSDSKEDPCKEGKEKKKRQRKDRKRDGQDSDSDSRIEGNDEKTSAMQEAQLRLEELHDEERGRRLAQEIKGFNWLEQKIKKGSLSSPPPAEESSPFSKTPPSIAPSKKDERDCRKSSLSGSSGGAGLRGHLQTAVPPLVPSSRVTALPKRRLSPHLPPLATSAALSSSANGGNMTVQGTISSSVPSLYGTSHGKTGTNCGKPCVAYNTTVSDKATLYSSTSCNKATLYGVNSDSLEVLFDSDATPANNCVRTNNNNASFYNGTNTVPSKFCGSTKNLASIHHSHVLSSAAVTCPSVITSTVIAPTVSEDWPSQVKGHIRPTDFSLSDSSASISSESAVVQHSCSVNSQSASSTLPPTPQQFSHKHTLLRHAFSEMLKNDSESSEETAQQGLTLFKFDEAAGLPKKQDVSNLEEALAVFTPLLTTSATRSQKSCGKSQTSTEVAEMLDCATLLVDHKKALSKVNSEEPPDIVKKEEIQAADEENNELQSINAREIQKVPEAIQKILECITDTGDETAQFFRNETKSDEEDDNDKKMQSSILLSLLYKELITTKQEVEKLRKTQELMLIDKGEKKEDNSEESKGGDAILFSEEKCEKRKCATECDSLEPQLDSKELSHPEIKKSKISIRNDLLPTDTKDRLATPPATSGFSFLPRNCSSPSRTSPSVLKANPEISSSAKVPLTSPTLSESSSELSVITLVSSAVSQTSHVLSRTSPGVSGISRTSLGLSKPTPEVPGLPKTSCTPMRTSPGLLRSSTGLPMISPGLSRTSPVLPRTSPGLPKMSPGAPKKSPSTLQSNVTVSYSNPAVSQSIQTCFAGLASPTSLPNSSTVMPKITNAQSDSVSGTVRSRHGSITIPQSSPTSRTCSVIPKTSPVISHGMSRTCPEVPKTYSASSSTPISKPEAQLTTGVSLNKLRTIFGISNSEVEVMPVSVAGKLPLSESLPQTYLKLVEEQQQQQQQQQPQETSILLNAFKGLQNRSTKDIEHLPSHGPSPFRCPQAYEGTRRTLHSQLYEGEIKRSAFSTSELPDFPPSVRKQPPPLKPAASLVRRHSDSFDVRPVDPMIHQLVHPSTLTAPAVSVHSTNSSPMEQHNTSLYLSNQPQCSPTQYPSNAQNMRINSESTERSREYQQVVAMSLKQHPYPQHLGSNAPMMRSLGPDKATIFPIPARMSTAVRPYKPPTPPTSTRVMLEQYQNENFYQSNFSFFERLRENIQQGCETGNGADRGGLATQERLQPPTSNVEKPLQPQTFAPRVLVRESIPETPRILPQSFPAANYANTNQHLSNVLPNHHGHFPNNLHPSTSIHHIASVGLHPGNHHSASTGMTSTNNTLHRNTRRSGNGEKRQCFNCPQSARFVCSGCKKAWYCSEQCQRGHWTVHNSACVP